VPDASDILSVRGGKDHSRSVDAAIAALAAHQHGVVSRPQLRDLGLGQRAIDHRIACGRLHPIHRGVFAVGHRVISRDAAWMAAVLAAGSGAVLSHRSAAALWGIRPTDRSDIEVSVLRQLRRPGIESHRVALAPDEVTAQRGIPVTTPARTLFDLAGVLTPQQLERAIDQAEIRRLGDALSLDALVGRYPRRPGVPAIRAILDANHIGQTITRSGLENRFLAVLDAHGLPRPSTNRIVDLNDGHTHEADCLWPACRLIAELDGYDTHGTRRAFERDRRRDRQLQAAGYRVIRITWRQLTDEPDTIAGELRELLRDTVSPS
jgi:Protein of unknown function (DUF559)